MRPLVSGDLIGQIGGVRLGGVDVGWTGLGPAEGEIVAAGELGFRVPSPSLTDRSSTQVGPLLAWPSK
jgi:hypothetical protein